MDDVQPPSSRTIPVSWIRSTLSRRGWRLLRQALLLATAVFLIDAIAGEKGLLSLLQARRDYQMLEQSLDRARTANAALREQARRLREEPAAIEEEARRELGLIKPGETLFIVKDIPPPSKDTPKR